MNKGGWSGCLFGSAVELGESVRDRVSASAGQVSPSAFAIEGSVVDVIIGYPVSCYQFATRGFEVIHLADFYRVVWTVVFIAVMLGPHYFKHLWMLCVVLSQVHILHRGIGVINQVED
jgi:hypothetical protein